MIIVNLSDGLGNQMFQYAFAYSLSKEKGDSVILDISSFEYGFRAYQLELLDLKPATLTEKDIIGMTHTDKNSFEAHFRKNKNGNEIATSGVYNNYSEPHFNFDENVFRLKGNSYFRGYWQSERYFKASRKELLELFKPKINHPLSQRFKKQILQSKSASLHVRRGDYVTNNASFDKHGLCSIDYYKKAIEHITKTEQDCHFFIFSDDINWTKTHLDFIKNKTFVKLPNDVPDYEEIYLMSLCQHNIIANSSFSWWGAWLNKNPDKIIITPEHWFKDNSENTTDLIPKEWIKIPSKKVNQENLSTDTAFQHLGVSFNTSL